MAWALNGSLWAVLYTLAFKSSVLTLWLQYLQLEWEMGRFLHPIGLVSFCAEIAVPRARVAHIPLHMSALWKPFPCGLRHYPAPNAPCDRQDVQAIRSAAAETLLKVELVMLVCRPCFPKP